MTRMTQWIEEADARQVREAAMYDRLIATPYPARVEIGALIAKLTSIVAGGVLAPFRRRVLAG